MSAVLLDFKMTKIVVLVYMYYYYYYACLMASFQDNLGKPVPER